ncbi:MAG: DUF1540 domain-containing protein [Candidatus Sumerlaeia bacterium]|nr:DUF1540 domain-containing protein [Candidatus Sumerlaeia bacterium]
MTTATKVQTCNATDCAFNQAKACHAEAVTIQADACLTYTKSSTKGGSVMKVANVGACKAAGCVHNANLMCTAASVMIGLRGGSVSCLNFSERK